MKLYSDSKTLIDSIISTKQIEDKLIRTDIAWLKERLLIDSEANISAIHHVKTKQMLADCLTKKQANPGNLLKTIRQGKFSYETDNLYTT